MRSISKRIAPGTVVAASSVMLMLVQSASATPVTLNPSIDGDIDPVDSTTNYGNGGDTYNTDESNDIKDFSGTSFSIGSQNLDSLHPSPARDLRGFLKFDLSSIPSNATITSATLELYVQPATNSKYGTPTVNRITGSNWDATTVTYSLGSSSNSTQIATISNTVDGNQVPTGYQSANITSTVQGWVTGSLNNYGLVIEATEGFTATNRTFTSIEGGSNEPELVIVFTPEPTCLATLAAVSVAAMGLRRRRLPTA